MTEGEAVTISTGDLVELVDAAWEVVDSWEHGDLAGAVNDLEMVLEGIGRDLAGDTLSDEACERCTILAEPLGRTRGAIFDVRFEIEDALAVAEAAEKLGITTNEFIRRAAMKAAQAEESGNG